MLYNKLISERIYQMDGGKVYEKTKSFKKIKSYDPADSDELKQFTYLFLFNDLMKIE